MKSSQTRRLRFSLIVLCIPSRKLQDSFPKLQPGMTKLPLEQLRILFMLYPKEWLAIRFFEYQHGNLYPVFLTSFPIN